MKSLTPNAFKGFDPQTTANLEAAQAQQQEAIKGLRAEVLQWYQRLNYAYTHRDKWDLGKFLKKAQAIDPLASRKGSIYGFLKHSYYCVTPGLDFKEYQPETPNQREDLVDWVGLVVRLQGLTKLVASYEGAANYWRTSVDFANQEEASKVDPEQQMRDALALDRVKEEFKGIHKVIQSQPILKAALVADMVSTGLTKKIALAILETPETFTNYLANHENCVADWLGVALVSVLKDGNTVKKSSNHSSGKLGVKAWEAFQKVGRWLQARVGIIEAFPLPG